MERNWDAFSEVWNTWLRFRERKVQRSSLCQVLVSVMNLWLQLLQWLYSSPSLYGCSVTYRPALWPFVLVVYSAIV